jgi:glycerol-3-phosphate acyltransferase PlsX
LLPKLKQKKTSSTLDTISIALDAMGGDHGLDVTLPGAIDALERNPELNIILVGDQPAIEERLQAEERLSKVQGRLTIQHATEVVEMDEPLAQALRKKKDSSMRVAINQVKAGNATACVSAGNTAALMAIARFVLKTLPGIERPAIVVSMPTELGYCQMLDLGANVDCTPKQLFQFAMMGSVLATCSQDKKRPKVALLNIGKEEIKGNDMVKGAHAMLKELRDNIDYIGFIESDQIYSGEADVVVCDGFVGNIALKSVEGVAHVVAFFLKLEFNRNWVTKLTGLLARPVLKRAAAHIDPRNYNGASMLGLNGIVIKSHGGADRVAMRAAIEYAILQVKKDIPQQVKNRVEKLVNLGSD